MIGRPLFATRRSEPRRRIRRRLEDAARAQASATRRAASRFPRHERLALACLALAIVTLTSFAQLAEDYVTNDPLVRWDERFARWLHLKATATGVDVFSVVTITGGTVFLAALTATAALYLATRRDRLDSAYLVTAFLGAEALTLGLKLSFARTRPELDHPFVDLHSSSFPSGHATVSTAVYGALAIVLARRTSSWRTRTLIVAAAALVVGVIGFSRLYLGAHFLSDVLAGFDAGFTWLMVCTGAWIIYRARGRRH